MSKIVSLLMLLLLLFGGACSLSHTKSIPQEVLIKIESNTPTKVEAGDVINRTMEVKNPQGQLSGISFIHGDTGYMKLWSTLTDIDATSAWNDLLLFEKVYKVKSIFIYVSSGGGSSTAGLALTDEIERISKVIPVTTYARGIVASATVPIFAIGTTRIASSGTMFMVHQAKMTKLFETEEEKDLIAQQMMFKILKKKYFDRLASRSSLSASEWLEKAENITWFDVDQAKAWGLVDKIE